MTGMQLEWWAGGLRGIGLCLIVRWSLTESGDRDRAW
jgi:hypothetical protein